MLLLDSPTKKTRTSKNAGVKTITNKNVTTLLKFTYTNHAKLALTSF